MHSVQNLLYGHDRGQSLDVGFRPVSMQSIKNTKNYLKCAIYFRPNSPSKTENKDFYHEAYQLLAVPMFSLTCLRT